MKRSTPQISGPNSDSSKNQYRNRAVTYLKEQLIYLLKATRICVILSLSYILKLDYNVLAIKS